jgi:dihydrofolate reductase
MAKLIYAAIASLDGYIADDDGNFDWAMPSDEVHAFANDLERGIGSHLYGRRMYDTMVFWETEPRAPDAPPEMREYAEIWRAADKVVYSTTLDSPSSARTRIESRFDPEAVRRFKAEAQRDLSIGGANLAGQAIEAGLVDELHLFLVPIIVGGGTPVLPGRVRVPLELMEERRFANGMVYLRYGVAS